MIYGKDYFSKSALLEQSLEEEMNNFSLMVENCDIDVMVESTILDTLKELWTKFKEWVKDLWDRIFGNTARLNKAKKDAEAVEEYLKSVGVDVVKIDRIEVPRTKIDHVEIPRTKLDESTNIVNESGSLPFSTMTIHFNKDSVSSDMKDSSYYDKFTRVSGLANDYDKIKLFIDIISDILNDARTTVGEIARISDSDYDKINSSEYSMKELRKKLKLFESIDTEIIRSGESNKENTIRSFKQNNSSIDDGLKRIIALQRDVKSLQERAEKITKTLSYKIRQVTGEKNKRINNSISSLVSNIIGVLKEFNTALGRVISVIQRVEIHNYNSYTRALIKIYNIPESEVNKLLFK